MLRRTILPLCLVVGFALPASAQMMGQGPPVVRGIWSPQVGSGAAYTVERGNDKREMEITITGKDDYRGKPGHWLEMYFKQAEMGEMVMKTFVVLDGENTRVIRMIFQNPEMGAFEMPVEMMNRGGRGQTTNSADISKDAELVGSESVTTPAGTFTCDHYRSKDGADIWIAKEIAPWGLVKMTSKEANMTLTRVISGAKTRVTGTPQKFDPAMMGQRP